MCRQESHILFYYSVTATHISTCNFAHCNFFKICHAVCSPLLEDGEWTTWTDWPRCSATCGNGTRSRARTCDGPFNGGLPCVGNDSQTEHCSYVKCSEIFYGTLFYRQVLVLYIILPLDDANIAKFLFKQTEKQPKKHQLHYLDQHTANCGRDGIGMPMTLCLTAFLKCLIEYRICNLIN